MITRITREAVDRQVAEMYSALDGLATCQDVDPADYTSALNRAREIEAELRERLAAQDHLDAAAPALLAACKAALDGLYSYLSLEGNCSAMTERDALRDAIAQAEGTPPSR